MSIVEGRSEINLSNDCDNTTFERMGIELKVTYKYKKCKIRFARLCMVLGALLSTYVLIFNIQILNIVHLGIVGFRSPGNFSYEATQAGSKLYRRTSDAVIPAYDTYQAMIKDDTLVSKSRSFPEFSSCPYQGLRKPFTTTKVSKYIPLPKCRRPELRRVDCQEMVKHFGPEGSIKAGKCEISNTIKLCTVAKRTKKNRQDIEISCDASLCTGNRISLGLFSESTGILKWSLVRTERLRTLIRSHITSSVLSPGFALLKCKNGQATQVLRFANILKRVETERGNEKKRRININILVQDSLSRAHFYRTLLKTASAFRDIIYNQSIPSTVLEFEKVQAHASNTYHSLQRLFAAKKYLHSSQKCDLELQEWLALENDTQHSCTYGIEDLLSRYKTSGYSTLLQEDHCWQDEWGSFLDPRRRLGSIKDKKTRIKRWENFLKVVQKSGRGDLVDDYGMSTLSCDVYQKFKVTNPFSSKKVPNVCFAGQHFASFFLEYAKDYAELNDMAVQPFIGYTHLLTSHDTNGKRIVNDDESLARFFKHSAHLRNTVTIFASDHGAKSTDFAAFTTQGRQEVFQPLLFIIIPHEVGKLLGVEIMNALVINQNRLVGAQDLHDLLVSIVVPIPSPHSDPTPSIPKERGLLKPIPLDRTCEQMDLNSDVLCLCEGMDKTISNNSNTVLWAAEYALGFLNNRIQEQYTKSLRSHRTEKITSEFYGYGTCQRYNGVGILRARHAFIDQKERLFLSLLVKPFDRKNLEIFDVDLSFSIISKEGGISLTNFIRVSPFSRYEQCADEAVDPQLCSCNSDHRTNSRWRDDLYVMFASQESFKLKPTIKYLDHPCLAIVSRSRGIKINHELRQNSVVTYEALNACANVAYTIEVPFRKLRNTKFSLSSSKSVTLLPRTVTFLLSLKPSKFGKYIPKFKFKRLTFKLR